MNRVTVRHIDVVRAANIVAVLYTVAVIVFGLIFIVPFALLGGLAGSARGDVSPAAVMGMGLAGGLLFLLIGVVFYGVIGWVTTAIACALYNWVAGRIGGLRLTVDVEGPYPGGGYPAPYAQPTTWQAPQQPAAPSQPGGPPPAPGR